MKTFLCNILVFLLIFCSCKKEEPRKIVITGIYDDSFVFHEFSPPLKVELTLETLTDNYIGSDSIDINLDGVYDLVIRQRIHNPPPSGRASLEQFPYYRLTLKNGLEVATKTEYYSVGHGSYYNINWVDTLNYENRIDNISEWSDTNTTSPMWTIPPISASVTFGCWYNLANAVKYIGIRMKVGSQYKLGWIKVNEISRENILFISYAIEK